MICESLLSREKSAWAVMWSVLIVHSPWFPGSANNYKVSKEYMNVVRLSSRVLFATSNQQMASNHGRQRRSVLVSALTTSYLTAMAVYLSNLCLKCYEDDGWGMCKTSIIDRASVSQLAVSVETAVWSDAAAMCRCHSFSRVVFGGHIVSYHIVICCVISYRIYHFLLRPYHAIIAKYAVSERQQQQQQRGERKDQLCGDADANQSLNEQSINQSVNTALTQLHCAISSSSSRQKRRETSRAVMPMTQMGAWADCATSNKL